MSAVICSECGEEFHTIQSSRSITKAISRLQVHLMVAHKLQRGEAEKTTETIKIRW